MAIGRVAVVALELHQTERALVRRFDLGREHRRIARLLPIHPRELDRIEQRVQLVLLLRHLVIAIERVGVWIGQHVLGLARDHAAQHAAHFRVGDEEQIRAHLCARVAQPHGADVARDHIRRLVRLERDVVAHRREQTLRVDLAGVDRAPVELGGGGGDRGQLGRASGRARRGEQKKYPGECRGPKQAKTDRFHGVCGRS